MPLITLGNPAIVRPNNLGTFQTGIDLTNLSNGDGTLTVVEVFLPQASIFAITFATFFNTSGNLWRSRAEANVGILAGGFHSFAVSLEVLTGDGIGMCTQGASVELTITGGTTKAAAGCFTAPTNLHDYGADHPWIMSLLATGFEPSGGQISVGHIQQKLLLL